MKDKMVLTLKEYNSLNPYYKKKIWECIRYDYCTPWVWDRICVDFKKAKEVFNKLYK